MRAMASQRPAAPFSEAAKRSILVLDGAMGSLLYERGVFVTQNFEQLNVARPDIVKKIHADYLAAGAQVIETNTFGANRFRLERYGLVNEVRNFNVAGARIAREVAGDAAYVGGSIGPTGLVPGVASRDDLAAAADTIAEQAGALNRGIGAGEPLDKDAAAVGRLEAVNLARDRDRNLRLPDRARRALAAHHLHPYADGEDERQREHQPAEPAHAGRVAGARQAAKG